SLSPSVLSFHLRRHGFLGPPFAARKPDFSDLAGLIAGEAYGFAVASVTRGHRDATGVAAGDLDFRSIHKRVESVGVGGEHDLAHRNQIERAPRGPPAPGPVVDTPLGRAVHLKGAQYARGAVGPESSVAIGGIGQNADGHLARRDDAGLRDVAQ